jgi:hypothetical protein
MRKIRDVESIAVHRWMCGPAMMEIKRIDDAVS